MSGKFTGGDNLTPKDDLKYYIHKAFMLNELRNGSGAYEMSNAKLGNSGPSFGAIQYDIGSNQKARDLLEQISKKAVDNQGKRFVSDEDIQYMQKHLYKSFNSMNSNEKEYYESNIKPRLDKALSSPIGKQLINENYSLVLDDKVHAVNEKIAKISIPANKQFIQNSMEAKVFIADIGNQYGTAVNDALVKFLNQTSDDKGVKLPDIKNKNGIITAHGGFAKVKGDLDISDLHNFRLQTAYGIKHPRDAMRRDDNIHNITKSASNHHEHDDKSKSFKKDIPESELQSSKNALVQKLIDKAKGEIGYIETGNNHTKYADKHIPFAQNKAWCDTFVDSMFIEAYGRPNAQKMLGGIASGTETSKENFQGMGLWHSAKSDYLPQPGDQIFFKNGKNEKRTVDHTGIVVKVENGKVYTIEGNTSVNKRDSDGDGVESKVHNLKANNIVGYGTPNWDVLLKQNIQKPATEPEKTPEKQPAATPEKPVQEKHTQEKPEKAADKVEKKEKAELSSQLSPQVQKFSQQCEEKLVECCNKKGITADSPQDFKNISMALTVKGLENGMTKIGQLDIETKGAVVMVFIVSQEEHTKFASVSANDAVKIPVQESIEKIQQMEQQKTQEQQMQQSQTQGMQR